MERRHRRGLMTGTGRVGGDRAVGSRRQRILVGALGVAIGCTSFVACRDATTTLPGDRTLIARAITGDARAALMPDGKLLLRAPQLGANEIDAAKAKELAVAYVATY
jgi:hypothetical protein